SFGKIGVSGKATLAALFLRVPKPLDHLRALDRPLINLFSERLRGMPDHSVVTESTSLPQSALGVVNAIKKPKSDRLITLELDRDETPLFVLDPTLGHRRRRADLLAASS